MVSPCRLEIGLYPRNKSQVSQRNALGIAIPDLTCELISFFVILTGSNMIALDRPFGHGKIIQRPGLQTRVLYLAGDVQGLQKILFSGR